eukprot:Opistho-1_new@11997
MWPASWGLPVWVVVGPQVGRQSAQQGRVDGAECAQAAALHLHKPLRCRSPRKRWQIACPHGPQGRRTCHIHRLACVHPGAGVGIAHIAGHDGLGHAAPRVVRHIAQVQHQAQRRVEKIRIPIRKDHLGRPGACARRVHATHGAAGVLGHFARSHQRLAGYRVVWRGRRDDAHVVARPERSGGRCVAAAPPPWPRRPTGRDRACAQHQQGCQRSPPGGQAGVAGGWVGQQAHGWLTCGCRAARRRSGPPWRAGSRQTAAPCRRIRPRTSAHRPLAKSCRWWGPWSRGACHPPRRGRSCRRSSGLAGRSSRPCPCTLR